MLGLAGTFASVAEAEQAGDGLLRLLAVEHFAVAGVGATLLGEEGLQQRVLLATGLEGDSDGGSLVFTGPAKVILYSDGKLLSPKDKTP